MPMTEKEYNGHLLDMVDLLEDIEELAVMDKAENVLKYIKKRRRQIERKLYQKLPLTDE